MLNVILDTPFLIDLYAKMNADDDYDDPRQRPNVYADTGADKDRVRTNPNRSREGASQPPIPMAVRSAVAEDQQRPFSNIYAPTLSDTAVMSDFINEQRGLMASLVKKLQFKVRN